MIIKLKNKDKLIVDDFILKCCVGKLGINNNKKEGDKSTPSGIFKLGNVFYRSDRVTKPFTKLKCIKINKNMKKYVKIDLCIVCTYTWVG